MSSMKPESPAPSGVPNAAHGKQEVRCAVRFPLALSVMLEGEEGEIPGLTRNISASGVLFALDRDLRVGLDIRFSMRMPHTVLGSPNDVMVHCKGRVVRCSSSHNEHLAAATIDEYQMAAQ
jgi:PilZ domain